MSQVEIVTGVSLSSLTNSVPQQLGVNWQQGHQRTQILILIQRHHRQKFESHAATISLKHPCWSLFYRPRKEVDEIQNNGLDTKKASFMFLDVALEDLGKWVGPLSKDDWLREEVIITPSKDADNYDSTKWTVFRDPWLEQIEVLPLQTAPLEIVAKAWLTIPTATTATSHAPSTPTTVSGNTGGVEVASDSAFAGKLADLTHSFGAGIAGTPVVAPAATPPTPAPAAPPSPAFVMPSGPVSIPNFSAGAAPEEEPGPQPVEAPPTQDLTPTVVETPIVEPTKIEEEAVIVESSEQDAEEEINSEDDEGIEIHTELIEIIQLLKVGGLETEQILESPAFVEVSERATAAGLDVWSILIENAS